MDVENLGDMLVICVGIFAMRLVYIQAWRYKLTFKHNSNPKLNQGNFDLPNQLII